MYERNDVARYGSNRKLSTLFDLFAGYSANERGTWHIQFKSGFSCLWVKLEITWLPANGKKQNNKET